MAQDIKASKYNLYFKSGELFCIYNTLTSGLVAVSDSCFSELQSGTCKDVSENTLQTLIQQRFVVPADLDETACYELYYKNLQYGSHEKVRFVIIPTYACNMRCVYCYQGEKHEMHKLDGAGENSIVHLISNYISTHKGPLKKVQLTFFGGEPLLCKTTLISLADKVRLLTISAGLSFESAMTTNATLIDQRVIDELIIPNGMSLQITIDGSKSIHDTRRIFVDGRGSYDKVMDAIKLLNHNGLKDSIVLRINIDRDSIPSLECVIKEFGPLVGKIAIGRLMAVGSNVCNSANCIDRAEYIANVLPKLQGLSSSFKIIGIGRQFGKAAPCGINKQNGFIVDDNLDVYKCEGLVGNADYCVGHLSEQGLIEKTGMYYTFATADPFTKGKCRACKMLPMCAGGCMYNNLLRTGNFNDLHCELTEEMVVGELMRSMKASKDSMQQ